MNEACIAGVSAIRPLCFFFFSSRRRHTRSDRDWSSDVCSSDLARDEGSIWREFLSKLIEVENPVLIHYGSFETVFLKRMRQRYGAPPSGSPVAKALESPINLLSVIFGQIYFPTYSNGLKDIAGWLGFKWSLVYGRH